MALAMASRQRGAAEVIMGSSSQASGGSSGSRGVVRRYAEASAAASAAVVCRAPCAKRRRASKGITSRAGTGNGSSKAQHPQLRRAVEVACASAATPQVGCRRVASPPLESAGVVDALHPPALSVLVGGPGGPYFIIAAWLGSAELCRLDAACRLLREMNGLPMGPWRIAGERSYLGMELDAGSGFLPFENSDLKDVPGVQAALMNPGWKKRCELFYKQVPTFSAPFHGSEIFTVEHPDEVAYCRCRLRTDLLAQQPGRGIYVEVEVRRNADNLSLAVVDFEGGGRSSVTFSPETGAVLRERKVRESPRAIEGTYIHLLPAAPAGRRFEGTMGLYLRDGHLAFFRRWSAASAQATSAAAAAAGAAAVAAGAGAATGTGRGGGISAAAPTSASGGGATEDGAAGGGDVEAHHTASGVPDWETTGFCTDLRWAQGPRLSICLAFRDDGPYRVRIAQVSLQPPSPPERSQDAYQDDKWSLLYGDDDHPLAI